MSTGGPQLHERRRRELADSFQEGGEHYQKVRPGYPPEAVEWMLPTAAREVADVGAGTGKFTADLVHRGLTVTAVDPSQNMLAQLRINLPAVRTVEGTAEETGLADDSFDAVTVAQAWHWCDPMRSSTEIARILRPGGGLSLVWNQLDVSVAWVHRLSRIMHAGDVHKPNFRPPVGPEFAGLESHLTRWEDELTPLDIMDLVKSRSYYLAANEANRNKVMANLRWYFREHLNHEDEEILRLPYLTQSWRAWLR